MSLPYHRGHINNNVGSMTHRGGGYQFGTRDQRVEEANRTLMEQENDYKMVW